MQDVKKYEYLLQTLENIYDESFSFEYGKNYRSIRSIYT